jgi:hypothetical protein
MAQTVVENKTPQSETNKQQFSHSGEQVPQAYNPLRGCVTNCRHHLGMEVDLKGKYFKPNGSVIGHDISESYIHPDSLKKITDETLRNALEIGNTTLSQFVRVLNSSL